MRLAAAAIGSTSRLPVVGDSEREAVGMLAELLEDRSSADVNR